MRLRIICCILSGFILISLSGCAKDREYLFGTWDSISVTNPDPFFRDTLPDARYGRIRVIFRESGDFTWTDSNEAQKITGSFTVANDIIEMTDSETDERIMLSYQIAKERLILKTNDGFTFTFKKQ